ncbi:hypothetical protein SAV31267_079700 [Streptomyces avermitilis]|uniref:4Fe-4S Wbl-type domain-containing protein n=1 Tax=Streptomyces avermitilis TaxID=33903 RepID=A0A4D4N4E8_STRAX|nr:hypothetical protein SAV31267_079700 [Streptomyces avermitilis]
MFLPTPRAAVFSGTGGTIINACDSHVRGRTPPPEHDVDPALIERFSPPGTISPMHTETITSPDIAWQEEALCAQTGADFFFPEPGSSVREAKRICGLCEIRSACLEYALTNDERFGVWAGSPRRNG